MRSDNLDLGSVPEWVYRVDSPPAVDDEPWQTDLDPLVPARGAVVGLAMLALAFAAGVLVGVLVLR